MAKFGTITLTGASGTEYKFNVYPFDTNFRSIGAVYAVTKRTPKAEGGANHTRIYIGETGDLSERFDAHHKAGCFQQNGANCICTHRRDDEQTRLEIEADLLGNYDPPCND